MATKKASVKPSASTKKPDAAKKTGVATKTVARPPAKKTVATPAKAKAPAAKAAPAKVKETRPRKAITASPPGAEDSDTSLVLKLYFALGVETGVILLGAYPEDQPDIKAFGYLLAGGSAQIVFACRPPITGAFVTEAVTDKKNTKAPGYRKFAAYLPGSEIAACRAGHFVALWSKGELKRFDVEIQPKRQLSPDAGATLQINFGTLLNKLTAEVKKTAVAKPPAAEVKKPAKVEAVGQFEAITDGVATGWAFDAAHPDRHPTVEIIEGDKVVGRGVADQFRQDLLNKGLGDGAFQFKARVSFDLHDDQPHRLMARIAGTHKLLAGGEKTFSAPKHGFADCDLVDRETTLKFAGQVLGKDVSPAERKVLLSRLESACIDMEMLDMPAARKEFLSLLEVFGNHGFLCCKVAETLLMAKRYDEAIKACKQGIKRTPKLAWAYWTMGNAHRLSRQWAEAEAAYRTGLAIAPGSSLLKRRLADVLPKAALQKCQKLISEKQFDKAVQMLKRLVAEFPDDLEIYAAYKAARAGKGAEKPAQSSPVESTRLLAFEAALASLDATLDLIEAQGAKKA